MTSVNEYQQKDRSKDKDISADIEDDEGEEEDDGDEEYDESEDEVKKGPSFVSQIRMRSNRGNKVEKLLKNEKMAHDTFWVENDYFGSMMY